MRGSWDEQRGLKAEYSSGRGRRRGGNTGGGSLNRIDPRSSSISERAARSPSKMRSRMSPRGGSRCPYSWFRCRSFRPFSQEFRVNWQGSVLAPETGEYEFLVQDGECRPAVGQRQGPAVDRRLGEVGQRHRVSRVDLPAGRAGLSASAGASPVQGKDVVDRAPVEAPAPSRRGDSAAEPLAEPFPETFVVQTPFPPDDRSVGYERGTSISKAWDQATTDAAIEVAELRHGPPQGAGRRRR